MVGSVQPVLVDGRARRNAEEWSGRTDNNRVVNFAVQGCTNAASAATDRMSGGRAMQEQLPGCAGAAVADVPPELGQMVDVEITDAMANSLRGRLLMEPRRRRA
jgi:tRNA-2-methylthio-N6-dimethylallyladenosine synthase